MHPHPRSAGVIGPVIALLLLLLLSSDPAVATEAGNTYHTTFTTITYRNVDDLHAFTRNIGSGLSFFSSEFGKDPRLTAKRVDNLVLRVMALLDMRMPGLRFSLMIHPDDREIRTTYGMFAIGKGKPVAYYDHDKRTIFVSANTVSDADPRPRDRPCSYLRLVALPSSCFRAGGAGELRGGTSGGIDAVVLRQTTTLHAPCSKPLIFASI